MTTPVLFADSVSPKLIPSSFSHVAAYATGRYVWPADQLARFDRHIEIAVHAGDPRQAAKARVLDCEKFDASFADFWPFAEVRHSHGHHDSTAYCSASAVPTLLGTMPAWFSAPWRLWVADWTGEQPTAEQVLAEIRNFGSVPELTVERIWAVQFDGGVGKDFDTSVLFGRDDFTRAAA